MSNRQSKHITRLRESEKIQTENNKKDEECVNEKRREREKWEKRKSELRET